MGILALGLSVARAEFGSACPAKGDELEAARTALAQGDLRTAIELTSQLLDIDPRHREAALIKGQACFRAAEQLQNTGRSVQDCRSAYRAALEAFESARSTYAAGEAMPGTALHALGWCYFLHGQYSRAIEVLSLALSGADVHMNRGAAQRVLGMAYQRAGQAAEAEVHLRAALAAATKVEAVDAVVELADLLLAQRRTGEARALLWDFVRAPRESLPLVHAERPYLKLLRLEFASNDFESVLTVLTAFRAALPDSLNARYELGVIRYRRGEFEAAEAEFSPLIESSSTAPQSLRGRALSWCGLIAAHRGNAERARTLSERALEILPRHAQSLQCLARAQQQLGETEAAKAALEKFGTIAAEDNKIRLLANAVENAPGDAALRLRWLRELIHAGRLDDAHQELQNSLLKYPDFAHAAAVEQELHAARGAKRQP
jgi:tetratricopeptide (TPR) repeat protein